MDPEYWELNTGNSPKIACKDSESQKEPTAPRGPVLVRTRVSNRCGAAKALWQNIFLTKLASFPALLRPSSLECKGLLS